MPHEQVIPTTGYNTLGRESSGWSDPMLCSSNIVGTEELNDSEYRAGARRRTSVRKFWVLIFLSWRAVSLQAQSVDAAQETPDAIAAFRRLLRNRCRSGWWFTTPIGPLHRAGDHGRSRTVSRLNPQRCGSGHTLRSGIDTSLIASARSLLRGLGYGLLASPAESARTAFGTFCLDGNRRGSSARNRNHTMKSMRLSIWGIFLLPRAAWLRRRRLPIREFLRCVHLVLADA